MSTTFLSRRARLRALATSEQQANKIKQTNAKTSDQEASCAAKEPVTLSSTYSRVVKKKISIRLDADVLAWFQQKSGKYQTLINWVCREYMARHRLP